MLVCGKYRHVHDHGRHITVFFVLHTFVVSRRQYIFVLPFSHLFYHSSNTQAFVYTDKYSIHISYCTYTCFLISDRYMWSMKVYWQRTKSEADILSWVNTKHVRLAKRWLFVLLIFVELITITIQPFFS